MGAGALRPGDPPRLGDYLITGRLGQGGQGVVYLGTGPDGEQVAIKVMAAGRAGGIDRSAQREIAAARQVAEFCTARVITADLGYDPPYVVSEYIDGPSLADVAPLRGADLIRLAISTATALTAIHRAGVVHRDFKPGNVLMAKDGPRVIDFGIARLAGLTATKSGLAGTPPYMAPEQFGDGPVGAAGDVFAWGSTMAYAATGRPPFGGDTIAAVAYRILQAEPDLGDLPEPLRAIVARCLAKDPAARPTARDVLLELLGEDRRAGESDVLEQGALAATVVVEPEEPTITATRVLMGRRNVLTGAGLAATGLVVTGALLWARSAGRTNITSTTAAATGSPSTSSSGTPEPAVGPPPAKPAELVAAVEAATIVTPLADFTYEGGLSQSSYYGEARGQLVFGANDDMTTDFNMRVESVGDTRQVIVIESVDEPKVYMDGKPVTGKETSEALYFAEMVPVTAGIGVLLDVISVTPRIGGEARSYSGSLVTTKGPQIVQDKISEITGGWTADELADTQLTWKLKLDARDRPIFFDLSWRAVNETGRVASSFVTTYVNWRAGSITAPQ
ncbi:serine/threonine-protein kinase [Nonomuraea sp. NEAU-A123]|uniref:serine/threonine-protein kinase n=1 Tax=Nonomuraea sp. NEAU-A123 TaxID=2839649 RepID=UPI0027DFF523|nr:serine/threonine-protein kinase [Nonomuraea sp. NEAU-A123]